MVIDKLILAREVRIDELEAQKEQEAVSRQRLQYENAILRHNLEPSRPLPPAAASAPSGTASRRPSITSAKSDPTGVPSREEKARGKVDWPTFDNLRMRSTVNRAVAASMGALRSNPYAPWTTVMTAGRGLAAATAVPATGALPDLPTYPATPPEWASSDDD